MKKLVIGVPFISTPNDTRRDAEEFNKWDRENSNKVQKIPTVSENPKFNKIRGNNNVHSK